MPPDSTTTTHRQSTRRTRRGPRSQVTGTVTAVHLEGAVLDPREVADPVHRRRPTGVRQRRRDHRRARGRHASDDRVGRRAPVRAVVGRRAACSTRVTLTSSRPKGCASRSSSGVHPSRRARTSSTRPWRSARPGWPAPASPWPSRPPTRPPSSRGATRRCSSTPTSAAPPARARGSCTSRARSRSPTPRRRPVTALDAATGAFDITLTPVPGGGWTITADPRRARRPPT